MYLTDKNYQWYVDIWGDVVVKIKGTSDQIYLTSYDLKEILSCLNDKDNEEVY